MASLHSQFKAGVGTAAATTERRARRQLDKRNDVRAKRMAFVREIKDDDDEEKSLPNLLAQFGQRFDINILLRIFQHGGDVVFPLFAPNPDVWTVSRDTHWIFDPRGTRLDDLIKFFRTSRDFEEVTKAAKCLTMVSAHPARGLWARKIDSVVVPTCLDHINGCPDHNIRAYCFVILGNLCFDNVESRDLVLHYAPQLVDLMKRNRDIREAVYLFSELFRHTPLPPPSLIAEPLWGCFDKHDAEFYSAVLNMTSGNTHYARAVAADRAFWICMEPRTSFVAAGILCNLVEYSGCAPEMTQGGRNVVHLLVDAMYSSDATIRALGAMALSRLASYPECTALLCEEPVLMSVTRQFASAQVTTILRESTRFLTNLIQFANDFDLIKPLYIGERALFKYLCVAFERLRESPEMLVSCLYVLRFLLKLDRDQILEYMEEMGTLDRIENLQTDPHQPLADQAMMWCDEVEKNKMEED